MAHHRSGQKKPVLLVEYGTEQHVCAHQSFHQHVGLTVSHGLHRSHRSLFRFAREGQDGAKPFALEAFYHGTRVLVFGAYHSHAGSTDIHGEMIYHGTEIVYPCYHNIVSCSVLRLQR